MNVRTFSNDTIDLTELTTALSTRRSLSTLLSHEERLAKVAHGLAAFAALDTQTRGIQRAMGEMAYKFLQLPIEEQKPIVEGLAMALDVPVPSYDNAVTGRMQLAHTIYGKQPDACRVKRGDKDSLAGKRLSECIRVYKVEAGLIGTKAKKTKRFQTAPPRVMRIAATWLLWAAESEQEREIVTELLERLGFEAERVEEWVGVQSAAA